MEWEFLCGLLLPWVWRARKPLPCALRSSANPAVGHERRAPEPGHHHPVLGLLFCLSLPRMCDVDLSSTLIAKVSLVGGALAWGVLIASCTANSNFVSEFSETLRTPLPRPLAVVKWYRIYANWYKPDLPALGQR